jgi:hypothetical protein
MGTTTQPTIAHGIARLHPDAKLPSTLWRWGPEWTLPMGRSGRWAINTNYNAAVRVEFADSAPGGPVADPLLGFGRHIDVRNELDRAREALGAEEEKRLAEWLGYADKREGAAFVRKFTARRRREYGDVPKVDPGELIRRGTGVWHIATGKVRDGWQDPDILRVDVECHGGDVTMDIGSDGREPFQRTTDPSVTVCRNCRPRPAAAAAPVAGELVGAAS